MKVLLDVGKLKVSLTAFEAIYIFVRHIPKQIIP